MAVGIQTKPEPSCPECGAKMVLRRPGAGKSWEPFWGCSQYPDCKGRRQIGPDGKPEDDDGTWDAPVDDRDSWHGAW